MVEAVGKIECRDEFECHCAMAFGSDVAGMNSNASDELDLHLCFQAIADPGGFLQLAQKLLVANPPSACQPTGNYNLSRVVSRR